MALISQSHQLRRLGFLILLVLSGLVVPYKLESQRNPVNVKDSVKVERNATIALFPGTWLCPPGIGYDPSCNKYLSNNFTLAPKVCLSGLERHNDFRLLEMPTCVGRCNESIPAVLVTHSDERCTGPAMVQPWPEIGPVWGWIQFPFPEQSFVVQHWSLIFHCHWDPPDEVSDPFERVYTTGEKLQTPLKPQGPLGSCDHRLPRLTDGSLQLVYEGCTFHPLNAWKIYQLPVDTCLSTATGKGLHFFKPAMCTDGSRARIARYWDNECKDLHDIADIKDEDLAWDACTLLKDTTGQDGSIAFYCDGPDAIDDVVQATSGKEMTLLKSTPMLPLPPKPWVPKGNGLILIGWVSSAGNHYISPKYEVLAADTCKPNLYAPLQVIQVPRCLNGTRANVAFFKWSYCKGSPVFYNGTDERLQDMTLCISASNGYNSMAFWCEGTGPWHYVPPPGAPTGRPKDDWLPEKPVSRVLAMTGLVALIVVLVWRALAALARMESVSRPIPFRVEASVRSPEPVD